MTLDAEDLEVTARVAPNGQAPRCDHVDGPVAEQRLPECTECLVRGWPWTGLLACLTCGWVACSDDSPGGHAKAHYQETDHPVFTSLEPGETWRWCYVHRRTV
jgi:uncharacterized UBP type Zn finger protein